MKFSSLLIWIVIFGTKCFSQNLKLQIKGESIAETHKIDSIKYIPLHKNALSIKKELEVLSEKLSAIGYIEHQIIENKKINDSSFVAVFKLKDKIENIHIVTGKNIVFQKMLSTNTKDTTTVPYIEIESYLNNWTQKLEQRGFSFAKLKLINIKKVKKSLVADLYFESGKQRKLNEITVRFIENDKKKYFPDGHLKQINKKYTNEIFNKETARKIQDDFRKFRFVNQFKNPEILFSKDTTKVYV